VDRPACSLVTIRPRFSFLELRARNDREACGQPYVSCDVNTGKEMLPYTVTEDRAATVDTLEQLSNAKCLTGARFTCLLRFYKSSRNFRGHEHTHQHDVWTKPGRIWTQSRYWRNATGGSVLGFRADDRNSHMTAQEVQEQTDPASGCPLRLSRTVRLKCPGVRSVRSAVVV
jgi:hypothetical protein